MDGCVGGVGWGALGWQMEVELYPSVEGGYFACLVLTGGSSVASFHRGGGGMP